MIQIRIIINEMIKTGLKGNIDGWSLGLQSYDFKMRYIQDQKMSPIACPDYACKWVRRLGV